MKKYLIISFKISTILIYLLFSGFNFSVFYYIITSGVPMMFCTAAVYMEALPVCKVISCVLWHVPDQVLAGNQSS